MFMGFINAHKTFQYFKTRPWNVDLHYLCLVLVEGKDVSRYTLEKEESTLDKDVPQHGGHQHTAEVPEYLKFGEKTNIRLIFSNSLDLINK